LWGVPHIEYSPITCVSAPLVYGLRVPFYLAKTGTTIALSAHVGEYCKVYIKYLPVLSGVIALTVSPALSNGQGHGRKPLIDLTIEEPGGERKSFAPGFFSGPQSYYYENYERNRRNRLPVMNEDGWTLSFRLAAPESVALISTRLSNAQEGPNFETLVLKDPDGCLDLSHALPTFDGGEFPADLSPIDDNCPSPQDEKFMVFNIDYDDAPFVEDNYIFGGCEGPKRERLKDDAFDDITDFRQSNKAYILRNPAAMTPFASPVGPSTGGTMVEDCYGYGVDEDISSLVVMVNTGAARVFDENLNYDNTRIRNMAGFVSGVTVEYLDNNNATTVVAHMPVRPAMLTPLTFFDFDMPVNVFDGDPMFPPSFDILRKIEDGPVETFTLSGITTRGELINEVIALTPNEFKVEIRAVVVEGDAPEFIEDTNFDGRFTAADLRRDYKLLSKEAVRRINIVGRPSLFEERDEFECPPLILVDLNGNNNPQGCDDGDGTSRSAVRFPR